jgi:hypothetical protein
MSEKDIDTTVWDALLAAAPAGNSDATLEYWANAWANRGA